MYTREEMKALGTCGSCTYPAPMFMRYAHETTRIHFTAIIVDSRMIALPAGYQAGPSTLSCTENLYFLPTLVSDSNFVDAARSPHKCCWLMVGKISDLVDSDMGPENIYR